MALLLALLFLEIIMMTVLVSENYDERVIRITSTIPAITTTPALPLSFTSNISSIL